MKSKTLSLISITLTVILWLVAFSAAGLERRGIYIIQPMTLLFGFLTIPLLSLGLGIKAMSKPDKSTILTSIAIILPILSFAFVYLMMQGK